MNDNNHDLPYYLALAANLKIGAKTFQKLANAYSNMQKVWLADSDDLINKRLSPDIIKNIKEAKKITTPEQEITKLKKYKISAITIKDEKYPRLLREIPDPPAVLYYRGEILPEDSLAIAIVGSRKYSLYGKEVAEDLARNLAESGMTIISGLALGIDGIAHGAVLNSRLGRTIAVLANGLDSIYPHSHRNLAEKIIAGRGAVISEFPPGTPALKHHFPVRNRIIAGLSLGVIVIEGALASGSLLTAKSSLDYNREVFAVPGNIYSETSAGPNNLIKMGAKLVTESQDILDELNIKSRANHVKARKVIPDSREEAEIIKVLDKTNPVHIDNLAKITRLNISVLNSKLVLMEMKGKVRNLGASQYVLGR